MEINRTHVEQILPYYHKEPKSRHDILCEALSSKTELCSYSKDDISKVISYIEGLISDCVEIARDELYGAISKDEARNCIRIKSISDKNDVIDIIFERASYYARK
jgi:hypothetical protein